MLSNQPSCLKRLPPISSNAPSFGGTKIFRHDENAVIATTSPIQVTSSLRRSLPQPQDIFSSLGQTIPACALLDEETLRLYEE